MANGRERVTITVLVKPDLWYVSENADEAKAEIEQKMRDAIGEFGDVLSIKVTLAGWPDPPEAP